MRHLNVVRFMQIIKDFITFGYIESKLEFLLSIFVNRLERVTRQRLRSRWATKFSSMRVTRLIVRATRILTNIINIVMNLFKAKFSLFTLAFLGQSSLL
jgi:hypothetical protein